MSTDTQEKMVLVMTVTLSLWQFGLLIFACVVFGGLVALVPLWLWIRRNGERTINHFLKR